MKTKLEKIHVPIESLIGIALDGASNMQGVHVGVKTLLQQENPKVLYVWCVAHRLNLGFEASLSCCQDVRNTIGGLAELNLSLDLGMAATLIERF